MSKQNFDAIHVNRVEFENVSLEDYTSRGMELVEQEEAMQWNLGDLAGEVTVNVGPKYLAEFAKSIRKPASTIRRYRDVSRAFAPDLREQFSIVPWSIFRDLCKYDRDRKVELLTRVADEGWSYEKFKAMMKPGAIDDGGLVPPKPELKFCVTCRKWFVVNEKELCPNKGEGECTPKKLEDQDHSEEEDKS